VKLRSLFDWNGIGAIAFLGGEAIASLTDIQDDSSYPPFQAPAKSKLNSAQSPQ